MVEQPTGGFRWMSWEKLFVHKNYCGMKFMDLASFNASMLGKKTWEFQTDEDSLVSHLYKARYFPRSDFFGAKIEKCLSYVW